MSRILTVDKIYKIIKKNGYYHFTGDNDHTYCITAYSNTDADTSFKEYFVEIASLTQLVE